MVDTGVDRQTRALLVVAVVLAVLATIGAELVQPDAAPADDPPAVEVVGDR